MNGATGSFPPKAAISVASALLILLQSATLNGYLPEGWLAMCRASPSPPS